MEYVSETLLNLWHQSGFFFLTWKNFVMIAIACVLLYFAIALVALLTAEWLLQHKENSI